MNDLSTLIERLELDFEQEELVRELKKSISEERNLYDSQIRLLKEEIIMLRQGYVWQDYDPSEGCYEDSYEGKWVKRWEPWRYVKDELPKVEVGSTVDVQVCYLNVLKNPCKGHCISDGKNFLVDEGHFNLGEIFAWRYEDASWPTPPKEE